MKRKLWSILIVALLLCAFAIPAFAEGESGGEQQQPQAVNAITAIDVIPNGGSAIACTKASGGMDWTPGSKLVKSQTYSVKVAATFADDDASDNQVRMNGVPMTLTDGYWTVPAMDLSSQSAWVLVVDDGTNTVTYQLRPSYKSSEAKIGRVIATLDLDDGSTDPVRTLTTFTQGTENNYTGTLYVPAGAGLIKFEASVNANGSVQVPDATRNMENNTDTKEVVFTVTSEDGTTTGTYTITIAREVIKSSVKTLSNLVIKRSSTTIYESSSPATSYTKENVGTGSVTVTPTVTDTGKATYEIYLGTTKKSTNQPATISLSSGTGVANEINIVVKAEDGTTKTYTYTLYTGSQGSSDNDLSSLYVRYGSSTSSTSYTISPVFDKDTTTYYAYVPYGRSSVYIHAGKSNSYASMTLDGSSFSSYTNVNLSTGTNAFDLKVTAQNGSAQTYRLYIYRATSSASDDADLDTLELRTSSSTSSKVTLSPSFNASKYAYTANVSSSQKTVRVYADAYHSSAIVKVNGEVLTGDYKTVDLNSTTTNIEVVVLAADYETTNTYKITVTRGESSNNYLSALRVYGSYDYLTLSPTFSKNTTAYTVKLSDDDTYFSFRPTAEDSTATITVDGVAVNSESWSKNINMTGNSKLVTIKVTAQSGDVRTYTVTLTKSEPKTIKLNIGKKEADVNGKTVTMDAAPYLTTIKGAGYTMVPIRFVSEQLGAKVDYTSTDKPIVITLNGKTVTLTIGKADKAAGLDVAPVAKNGRTYVPLRYVSEQLGATVDYNSTTKLITITQK